MLSFLLGVSLMTAPMTTEASAAQAAGSSIPKDRVQATVESLRKKHGATELPRIERGVDQAARLWREKDGSPKEFQAFCEKHFVPVKAKRKLLDRFEDKLEKIHGHLNALNVELNLEVDEDRGPMLPVDLLFAQLSPAAHVTDDLFKTKLAFAVLLNFRVRRLDELLKEGGAYTRAQWAAARLAQRFADRVPAEVYQAISEADAIADNYIANYNIHMDRLLGKDGKPAFRKGLKLISHWGLRDEIRALYADPKKNLGSQELIHQVMLRIIRQEIPEAVVGNGELSWDPKANTVGGVTSKREPDTRYKLIKKSFEVRRLEDPYYPDLPNFVDRSFDLHREMPEAEVEKILVSVLEAPVGEKAARMIRRRLGRELRPFDIWYDGFKARGSVGEEKLDRMVRDRYPTAEAFENDIEKILRKLGFDAKTAKYVRDRIEVDASRGAGHAWGAQMRGQKAHLRTRVPKGGMDYKGFNIAVHELGHNVEQVFSIHKADHPILADVPNNAFTEGFAFVFQARDLDILGVKTGAKDAESLKALDVFWATREIGGVALVDMKVWRWMYDHPDATPEELREAVIRIATRVWNKHFAKVMGVKDSPILGVYSHMISNPLYLSSYPLGYIIAFQVEDYLKSRRLGPEMERMCAIGMLTPDAWMREAVGSPVSAQPLIEAADRAIRKLN